MLAAPVFGFTHKNKAQAARRFVSPPISPSPPPRAFVFCGPSRDRAPFSIYGLTFFSFFFFRGRRFP
jgi:hypothetical protein